MNRRKFVAATSLTAIALSALGSVVALPNGKFNGDCETTSDILGPFYRPNAPIRSNLLTTGLSGTRIKLKGKVYKSDCITPQQNAEVEIWHCNSEGEYDLESNDFNQRARLITNELGEYSFLTILPGKYLNGRLYRPAHIHFRITEENSQEIVSQIYFMGDPHIVEDPWASKEKAQSRILNIIPEDLEGNLSVNFDIYLKEK